MSKKYAFWGKDGAVSVPELQARIRQNYINKYYNLWMSKFKWDGLDEGMEEEQENYIMRKFWGNGTIAVRQDTVGDLIFADYAAFTFNMYDFPEEVTLLNPRAVPLTLIPRDPQVVNKDVVLGWCQPNHKPIYFIVNHYIELLVQADMVINTNIQLQKMPFLVGVNETDEDKMKDVVKRILNNEIVVYASLEDLQRVQTLATQTPYIVDKLTDYKRGIEHELMTFLGIDNNGAQTLEQTHITVDAVNANNDVINDYGRAIEEEIQKWLNQIERVFGRKITIKSMSAPVNTVHEEPKEVEE